MKTYLNVIRFLQQCLLGISILIMLILPLVLVFLPEKLSEETTTHLYDVSHAAVFLVMLVRPLADIFMSNKWIRPLVILRKGTGVLAASIAVSFIFSKLMIDPTGYLQTIGTLDYWSLRHFALLAHTADISAVILLITSNNLSKRILGVWWKRVQRLSYVFFYSSSLYVLFIFGDLRLLLSMIIITTVTVLAYRQNKRRKTLSYQTT